MDEEVKTAARRRMQGFCRVCPRCDGWACAGQVPGMGGTGTGSSFKQNLRALEQIKIEMRTLHAVQEAETGLQLFGRRLSMPILVSPLGGVQYNMSSSISEYEYISAMTAGAHRADTLCGSGDGEVPEIFEAALQTFERFPETALPFIKPWARPQLEQRIEQLESAGADVCGMDIDAAGLITLKELGQPVYPKSPQEIRQIISASKMKWILKGVMTADEARIAVDTGAAAIIVSNHGGRVLDHTPGTADRLPEIADAVGGAVTVLVDGGVRCGTDVFKMLALGADAVMVGRPAAIAAIGGGAEALAAELGRYREELCQVMVMTGAADLDSINSSRVRRI